MCSCGNPIFRPRPHECRHFLNRLLPSVAFKRGQETKKNMYFLIGWQTWGVLSPNIIFESRWSKLSPQTDQRVSLTFHFSQRSCIIFSQKPQLKTFLGKLFLTSKNSCKEYFVERKQIKSTRVAYSKLRMYGAKRCHVCTQLEHVFSSRVHA